MSPSSFGTFIAQPFTFSLSFVAMLSGRRKVETGVDNVSANGTPVNCYPVERTRGPTGPAINSALSSLNNVVSSTVSK